MNCKKILIHDAARPSPPKTIIKNLINTLKKNDAVIPAIKITDATKRANENIIFKNTWLPKYQTSNPEKAKKTPKGIFWLLFIFFKTKPKITKIPAETKVNHIEIKSPFIPNQEPIKAANFASPPPSTGLLNIFLPKQLNKLKKMKPKKEAIIA